MRISNLPHAHTLFPLFQDGNRIYTLKKVTATGGITKSAHPGKASHQSKQIRKS